MQTFSLCELCCSCKLSLGPVLLFIYHFSFLQIEHYSCTKFASKAVNCRSRTFCFCNPWSSYLCAYVLPISLSKLLNSPLTSLIDKVFPPAEMPLLHVFFPSLQHLFFKKISCFKDAGTHMFVTNTNTMFKVTSVKHILHS